MRIIIMQIRILQRNRLISDKNFFRIISLVTNAIELFDQLHLLI